MSTKRISGRQRGWLVERLSRRDHLVLQWIARLRLVSGQQVQALCFDELRPSSAPVVRGRVLGRLRSWGLVEIVERRVGGSQSGSSSPIYRLSAAGYAIAQPAHPRAVKPYTERFTLHTLAISQLATDLVRAVRGQPIRLVTFLTEPASWMPDALGSYLKPDACLQLQTSALTMHWWVEVDLGTESLPTLERKLRGYLDFIARGQQGPAGVVPRVLITLTSDERLLGVEKLLDRLPEPARDLFVASRDVGADVTLLAALRQ